MIVILTALVLVAYAAVTLAPTLQPQANLRSPLRSILSAEGCEAACWRGVQPGTTLADYEGLAANFTGVANTRMALAGGPGRVYIIELENPNLLTTSPSVATVFVYFDSEGRNLRGVSQIELSELNLCPSTILDAYGIPLVNSELPRNFPPRPDHIGLGYPHEGLLFWFTKDSARIDSAAILPETIVNLYFESGESLPWTTILDDSLDCQDNFHH
jgi:hypothetical protein